MKCGKVKNPCKICFQSVSNRNGLQCKGACKKWAHFKCLNYTPGKISDIKAGLIKITCPCPDCTTSEPKEILTNPPYTCTNEQCPATKRPSCEFPDCPNKQNPIPSFPPANLSPPRSRSPKQVPPDFTFPTPAATRCPTPPRESSCPPSPRNATPPRVRSPPRKSSCPPSPRSATPPRVRSPPRKSSCPSSPKKASSPGRPISPRRPASPPLKITAAGPQCPLCPTHCPKDCHQKLATKKPISPQRSQSCSLDSPESFHSGKSRFAIPRSCSSDSALLNVQDQKMLYSAIEQMCETVGQLSCQLKDLMCKMMNVFQQNKQNRN